MVLLTVIPAAVALLVFVQLRASRGSAGNRIAVAGIDVVAAFVATYLFPDLAPFVGGVLLVSGLALTVIPVTAKHESRLESRQREDVA